MNGIYHADFTSSLGGGSGTVYLENGVLRGGDAVIAYVGTYAIDGDTLKAQAKLVKHGSGFSILGDATSLSFQGKIGKGIICGVGTIPDNVRQAKISLSKITAL